MGPRSMKAPRFGLSFQISGNFGGLRRGPAGGVVEAHFQEVFRAGDGLTIPRALASSNGDFLDSGTAPPGAGLRVMGR